jgi:hypothetical protein
MTQQWDKESREALIAYRWETQRFPHGVETQNFASLWFMERKIVFLPHQLIR